MIGPRIEKQTIQPPPINGGKCFNCGHPVDWHYCPKCGQRHADVNQGIGIFIREFLEEFLQYDSKLIRTLIPLFAKPGYLTQEWITGKRARYITPLKLYLTMSAILFLVISLKSSGDIINVDSNSKTSSKTKEELAKAKGDISKLNIPAKSEILSKIDEASKADQTKKTSDSDSGDSDSKSDESEKGDKATAGWLNSTMTRAFGNLSSDTAEGKAERVELGKTFVSRLSTLNLILLPIFALLFKLLYIRRSRFYVEHLVFALHYYAFISISTVIAVLVPFDIVRIPIILWILVYLPLAMFFNYRQGFFKTMAKCSIFCFIYLTTVGFGLVGLLVVTAIQTRASVSSSLTKTKQDPVQQPKVPTKP